jgi:hypothetical protein
VTMGFLPPFEPFELTASFLTEQRPRQFCNACLGESFGCAPEAVRSATSILRSEGVAVAAAAACFHCQRQRVTFRAA